jgi:ParB/RepB/Spo0J family partition protein
MKLKDIVIKANIRKDLGDLTDLAASIKEQGIIEPLVVYKDQGKTVLLAGHRRHAAAKLAGVEDVPVHEIKVPEGQVQALQLAENLHREDLTPFEVSAMIGEELKKRGFHLDNGQAIPDGFNEVVEQIAKSTGAKLRYVKAMARLAFLPEAYRKLLENDNISVPQALLILSLPPENQARLLDNVFELRSPNGKGPQISLNELEDKASMLFGADLSRAPFSLEEPYHSLPCVGCQWNTANTQELFPTGKAGLCRQPECYTRKCQVLTTEFKESVKKDNVPFVAYTGLNYGGSSPETVKGKAVVELTAKDKEILAKQTKEDATFGLAVVRAAVGRKPQALYLRLKGKQKEIKKSSYQKKDWVEQFFSDIWRTVKGTLYEKPAADALPKLKVDKAILKIVVESEELGDIFSYADLDMTADNVLRALVFKAAVDREISAAEKLLGVSFEKAKAEVTKKIQKVRGQLDPLVTYDGYGWPRQPEGFVKAIGQYIETDKLVLPAAPSAAEQAPEEDDA